MATTNPRHSAYTSISQDRLIIMFTLLVDDFGIKAYEQQHLVDHHLLNTLRLKYTITTGDRWVQVPWNDP